MNQKTITTLLVGAAFTIAVTVALKRFGPASVKTLLA